MVNSNTYTRTLEEPYLGWDTGSEEIRNGVRWGLESKRGRSELLLRGRERVRSFRVERTLERVVLIIDNCVRVGWHADQLTCQYHRHFPVVKKRS
jgi:hypothetical protein